MAVLRHIAPSLFKKMYLALHSDDIKWHMGTTCKDGHPFLVIDTERTAEKAVHTCNQILTLDDTVFIDDPIVKNDIPFIYFNIQDDVENKQDYWEIMPITQV